MKAIFKFYTITTAVLVGLFNAQASPNKRSNGLCFKENKGQVCDQNNLARQDVLFYGAAKNFNFYLKERGVSYQIENVTKWKEVTGGKSDESKRIPETISIYRIDINYLNANQTQHIEKSLEVEGYENYYLEHCPNGALDVKSYEQLTFKNIYNGIDLRWYQKNQDLEYDFILSPFADYTQIQLEIKGAINLSINTAGELIIETPFGEIVEKCPKTFQEDKAISSKWKLNKNIVSFEIGEYDHSKVLTIDPIIRMWGTYYGGSGADYGNYLAKDNINNVFLVGETASSNNISTVGAHKVNLGGSLNAYMVKFNSAGVRQFATYYGGTGFEFGTSCAVDVNNNIFLGGYTQNSTGTAIATPGAHQIANAGTEDGYLVKFNSSGVRQWATFYGGVANDRINSCSVDANGNVFVTGLTVLSTGTAIATAVSHQSVIGGNNDAFLAKFNTSGVRQWGTYYGGTGNDYGYGSAIDASGNIYICGECASPTGTVIATPGSHQSTAYGSTDAFLVKFNTAGVRQYGTYYGGTGYENSHSCAVDAVGNVFLTGETSSPTSTLIATVGSHQSTYGAGGSVDAYLVKFNSSGVRQWGTYYGGTGYDYGYSAQVDVSGNVYICGLTGTSTGTIMASVNGYQALFGGGTNDAYLAKFNPSGVRSWATYYGGTLEETGRACLVDANNNVYLCGESSTNTGSAIASPAGHQITYGGGAYDAFLVSLFNCINPADPTNSTPVGNQTICAMNSATLSASGTGTLNWFANPTGGLSLGSGTAFVTSTLSAGIQTLYAEALTCTMSVNRVAITVTVLALPSVSIQSSSSVICIGETASLTSSGANSYTWNTNATSSLIVVSPSVTSTYSVIGINGVGCSNSYSFSQIVSPCTGIHNFELIDSNSLFQFYPNPTSGDLFIEVENISDYFIHNVLGELVNFGKLSSDKNRLDLSSLSKGIYHISIKQNNLSSTKKFIIN